MCVYGWIQVTRLRLDSSTLVSWHHHIFGFDMATFGLRIRFVRSIFTREKQCWNILLLVVILFLYPTQNTQTAHTHTWTWTSRNQKERKRERETLAMIGKELKRPVWPSTPDSWLKSLMDSLCWPSCRSLSLGCPIISQTTYLWPIARLVHHGKAISFPFPKYIFGLDWETGRKRGQR